MAFKTRTLSSAPMDNENPVRSSPKYNVGHMNPKMVTSLVAFPQLLYALDGTSTSINLPLISGDFESNVAQAQWLLHAPLLIVSTVGALAGKLGDKVGRALLFKIGLFTYSLSSFFVFYAPSLLHMIVYRALGAVGLAVCLPVAAPLSHLLTKHNKLPTTLALNNVLVLVGTLVSPTLAARAGDTNWRIIYLLLGFLQLFHAIYVSFRMPAIRRHPTRIDVPGVLLLSLGVLGLVFGTAAIAMDNVSGTIILISSLSGVVSLVLFFIWSRHALAPVFASDVFNSRVICSLFACLAITLAGYGSQFWVAYVLRGVYQLPGKKVGNLMTMPPAIAAVVAITVARLLKRYVARVVMVTIVLSFALSMVLETLLLQVNDYLYSIAASLVLGLMTGFLLSNQSTVLATSPAQHSSSIGSLTYTVTQFGHTLGIGLTVGVQNMTGSDPKSTAEYALSIQYALWTCFIFSLIALPFVWKMGVTKFDRGKHGFSEIVLFHTPEWSEQKRRDASLKAIPYQTEEEQRDDVFFFAASAFTY
eukprot:gnl/Dysnectes_brevis/2093_a2427_940.p1 GENE.gnl/Dysnectes_brevis/2093_a2427_940~~gnl/Dysnectes_brevis/2093_a2427_940.p1  ORF type:complete len:531 (-),score=199.82 gnl/Dysnectes_brevis/2093_a2427_940:212-1804(-)